MLPTPHLLLFATKNVMMGKTLEPSLAILMEIQMAVLIALSNQVGNAQVVPTLNQIPALKYAVTVTTIPKLATMITTTMMTDAAPIVSLKMVSILLTSLEHTPLMFQMSSLKNAMATIMVTLTVIVEM